MDTQTISNIANSEVVFAILFIAGLVWVFKYGLSTINEIKHENKEREDTIISMFREQIDKSDNRERQLMEYLEKSTVQQAEIVSTLKVVQEGIERFESRVERNFNGIWKELSNKQDKISEKDFIDVRNLLNQKRND